MNKCWAALKTSVVATLLLTLLLGGGYPLLIWGIGQLCFHKKAGGSLLYNGQGRVVGSEYIGQSFTLPQYFHPRPSAANYNAASSAASNLGPTSKKLVQLLRDRTAAYRSDNQLAPQTPIPADAVTASGSGLDPHISLENALLQAPRVATARGVPLEEIHRQLAQHTEGWLPSEKRVHVLRLNLALDKH